MSPSPRRPSLVALAFPPFLLACNGKTVDDTAVADLTADPGFVLVGPTSFDMGCTQSQQPDCTDDGDETLHAVTLSTTYEIAATEVTQAQFLTAMGDNPASFADCGDDCPVENITWHEAAAYANALSDSAGLDECYVCHASGSAANCTAPADVTTCTGFRLPTEAEWEGAARCNTDDLYAGSMTSSDVAWTVENSGGTTQTTATLAANGCGLYDMSGNVWEWVEDWYGDYGSDSVTDPVGPDSGSGRVLRGGDWSAVAIDARVSHRVYNDPTRANGNLGFRVARTLY